MQKDFFAKFLPYCEAPFKNGLRYYKNSNSSTFRGTSAIFYEKMATVSSKKFKLKSFIYVHFKSSTSTPMPVRLERLIELIHDAQRWNEGSRDYMPELGCSKCGKGCMPLCGLGLNRKVTPLEYKDVVLKSRKMRIETGRRASPLTLQVGFDLLIMIW